MTPFGCPNRFLGDGQSNVTNVVFQSSGYLSQQRISSPQMWRFGDNGNTGDGTRFSPMSPIRNAVYYVRGGVAQARVHAFGADYYEIANNGGPSPILLSNPCVIVREPLPERTSVILR